MRRPAVTVCRIGLREEMEAPVHDVSNSAQAAFVNARQWARKARDARQKAAELARSATRYGGNFEMTALVARIFDAQTRIHKFAGERAKTELARAYRLAGGRNPLDEVMAKRLARRAFLSRVG